eukprot:gene37894-61287_t
MKFNHINVHNLHSLIPTWAIDPFVLARHLDSLFSTERGEELAPIGSAVYQSLPFWIACDATAVPPTVRVCTPDEQVNLN